MKRKLIYVELIFDDGTKQYLEGDAATKWAEAIEGFVTEYQLHGGDIGVHHWVKIEKE